MHLEGAEAEGEDVQVLFSRSVDDTHCSTGDIAVLTTLPNK